MSLQWTILSSQDYWQSAPVAKKENVKWGKEPKNHTAAQIFVILCVQTLTQAGGKNEMLFSSHGPGDSKMAAQDNKYQTCED